MSSFPLASPIPGLARIFVPLLLGALAGGHLAGCAADSEPQAGVISTGNAGRVLGSVRNDRDSSGGIEGAVVVLEVLNVSTWNAIETLGTDAAGGFEFDSLPAGTYRVTARDALGNSGTSAPFALAGDESQRLVVVLVPISKVKLAFLVPNGTVITSVAVEGTGVVGVKTGDAWMLELRKGTSQILFVRLSKGAVSDTIRYLVTWSAGEPTLVALDAPDAPAVEPQVIDSVVLLADWDFTGSDTLVDLSGRGNTGIAHGGVTPLPGISAWRFDGVDDFVSLGECILRKAGTCADWSDGNVTIQTVLRLESQVVDPLSHVWTFHSGNGEITLKRFPDETLSIGTASPAGFAGLNIAWKDRLGTWVDLTIVRDSVSDSMTVYLDGMRAGAFLAPAPLHSSAGIPPALGVYTGRAVPEFFGKVDIDRMRIWAGKFDADQVLALHRGL